MRKTFNELAGAVERAGIASLGDFEALVFQLSGHERRLFQFLSSNGEADTVAIRQACSIGNISDVARRLNAKLKAAGDKRRVRCTLLPHTNKFNEKTTLGHWRLEGADHACAA